MMNLKDYMLVEIPLTIDWSIFGEDISDEKKQEILSNFQEDLINSPIINYIDINEQQNNNENIINYNDHRIEGMITNTSIIDNDKISAFGVMWVQSALELQKVFSQSTGEYEWKIVGVNIAYNHKLNKTIQKVTEIKNKIYHNFKKTISKLNINKDGDKK